MPHDDTQLPVMRTVAEQHLEDKRPLIRFRVTLFCHTITWPPDLNSFPHLYLSRHLRTAYQHSNRAGELHLCLHRLRQDLRIFGFLVRPPPAPRNRINTWSSFVRGLEWRTQGCIDDAYPECAPSSCLSKQQAESRRKYVQHVRSR